MVEPNVLYELETFTEVKVYDRVQARSSTAGLDPAWRLTMKMFVVALAGLAIMLSATMAEAQTPTNVREVDAYPFAKHILGSKEEYAEAVETCNQDVLYVDCNQMVATANTLWTLGLTIPMENEGPREKVVKFATARKEFANWMRRLDVRPCPQSVVTSLARVVKFDNGQAIELEGTHRAMKMGELCLVETNQAKWVMSLTCGNFITGTNLPFTGEGSASPTTSNTAPPTPTGKFYTQEDLDKATQEQRERDRAAEVAKLRAEPQPKPPPQTEPTNYREPPKRSSKKGKVAAIVVGAAVGTGVAICAVNHCWETTIIQTTKVTVGN